MLYHYKNYDNFIFKIIILNKYMIIHKKYVNEEVFQSIYDKKKICEIRLNQGSFSEINKNDIIIWFYNIENEEKTIKTQITKIRKFKSFYNGIKNCRLHNIFPDINSIKEALHFCLKPEGFYTKEEETEQGVLCIEFEIIQ